MDFPFARMHKPVLSSLSLEAIGSSIRVAQPAAATWPVVKLAIFVPFKLDTPYILRKLWWMNGGSVSGNVDCGVYMADNTSGMLLASAGSTAQASTSVIQAVTLGTPVTLGPGRYYMALAIDNTTATVWRSTPGIPLAKAAGMAQQTLANLPLPATATFATIANDCMPLFGIASALVI